MTSPRTRPSAPANGASGSDGSPIFPPPTRRRATCSRLISISSAARDAEGRPRLYPGSPLIATRLARAQDRAIFCELRADAFAALQSRFARDKRVKTIHLDGYLGLSAFVPPKERRGLVLVDPPFEQRDEAERMLQGFLDAYRKWPTGIYALWLPIKDDALSRSFVERLRAGGVNKILRLDLSVGGAEEDQKLRRTSLVVANPPFTFEQEARLLGAFLAEQLARGPGAGFEIEHASAP